MGTSGEPGGILGGKLAGNLETLTGREQTEAAGLAAAALARQQAEGEAAVVEPADGDQFPENVILSTN